MTAPIYGRFVSGSSRPRATQQTLLSTLTRERGWSASAVLPISLRAGADHMPRHQQRDDRVERLRAMWKAQGANTPQRANFRFTVEHCNPVAVTAARRETKRHSDDQVVRIAESLLAFGITVPVVVDRQGRIIAGHAVWLAAQLLGLDEIPVVRRDDLSEDEARLLSLALNRLAERSEWDEAALGQELNGLLAVEHELPFDVAITGFDAPEQDRYLARLASDQEDEEQSGGPHLPVCTQPGDLWLLDRHQVLCGDATLPESYVRLMGDQRAQMIIADCPYNVPVAGHVSSKPGRREFAMASGEMSRPQFTAFLQTVNANLALHSNRASVHLLFMDHRHIVEMMTAGEAVYSRLLNLICWVKDNGGQGSLWRSRHELIFAWQNGRGAPINNVNLGKGGRNRTNVWEAPGANTFRAGRSEELGAHPTPKPVSLLREAIKDVSHRNGIVLDPFLGGGATLIAAERTGRRCRGLEIDPEYVDATLRRWERVTGREAMHAETGLTFSATAAARTAAPVTSEGIRLRSRPRASTRS